MKLADFGLAIEVDGDKQGKFGKFRETKKHFRCGYVIKTILKIL